MKRRQLLRALAAGGGVSLAGAALGGYLAGFRFPILQYEPAPRPTTLSLQRPDVDLALDQAYLQHAERRDDALALRIRAHAPDGAVSLRCARRQKVDLLWCNLSPRAVIDGGDAVVDETRPTRVNRHLQLDLRPGEHRITASVPFAESFRFAVSGDSGGGGELAWCLARADALGADFFLHAGDFYYAPEDYRAIGGVLDASPLPVYASIGNHDFHDGTRFVHRAFTSDVGPRNTLFTLGETVFVNFDTAASTWPVNRGGRAALFQRARALRERFDHFVLMTHRPLHSPDLGPDYPDEHTLAQREYQWTAGELATLMPRPVLLAGHLHTSAEHEEDGMLTYISGDGLGTRDLASGRSLARILLGEKAPGQEIAYRWAAMEMPASARCHVKGHKTVVGVGRDAPTGSFGPGCPGAPISYNQ